MPMFITLCKEGSTSPLIAPQKATQQEATTAELWVQAIQVRTR